jgi:hypothetical protein
MSSLLTTTLKPYAIPAAIGAASVCGVGILGATAVPMLMSATGKVVAGVGTIHAAGGAAATVQSVSATLLTIKAVGVGAAVGAGTQAAVDATNALLGFVKSKL